MYRSGKNILKTPDFSWKRTLAHVSVSIIAVGACYYLPSGEYIEQAVSRPIDYRVRNYLGQHPVLHPKLKLLAVDDSTVAFMKSSQLSMRNWANLIKSIEAKQPRRIFIDKIFGFEDQAGGGGRSFAKWERLFRNRGKHVVGGAFVSPRELKHRAPLDLSDASFQLEHYVDFKIKPKNAYRYYNQLPIPHARSSFVYGPYPEVRRAFAGIGHIQYGINKIAPFLRINKDVVLPYFGILIADERRFINGQIYLDGQFVPTLASGEVLVNLMPFHYVMDHTKSILRTLQESDRNQAASLIEPGDTVMIMPLLYTGNTDFNGTAIGQMPASFVHVAVINSVLSGQWITPINVAPLMIILGALLGAVLALRFRALGTWLGFSLTSVAVVAVMQYLFSYHGISVPWIFGTGAMFTSCLSLYVSRSRIMEGKASILRNALDGAISSHDLQNIVRDPRQVNLEAREQVITVMFIDVVGYSLLAENQIPRLAFDQLKSLLNKLSAEIHHHGGIVNKTLGDGLLCLFGYNFETDTVSTDHAERAVACAIAIQEKNLKLNLRAAVRGEPVYPLRIGLHTASVFLGDLGSGERIDFTAVGNGVNYAKRMEQAAEMHSVLFSSTTKDLVASLGLASEGLKKRMVSIKHHTNLIEAYEYDPFYGHPEARAKALEAYRQCASLARMEQRFTVNHPELLVLRSSVGEGNLINYSVTGLSIKLKSMLVRGSTIMIQIDSIDGKLAQQIKVAGIDFVQGEVRWMYSESDGHVHGILFRDLPEAKALRLIDTLRYFDVSAKASRTQQQIA